MIVVLFAGESPRSSAYGLISALNSMRIAS
jgi:hypothetical protein